MTDTIDRNVYGARETAGLVNASEYHAERRDAKIVDWTTPGLTITRLRLISDPGFPMWDVSYCHGEIDGRAVDVQLPFGQLPKRGLSRAIVDEAIKAGVYAKRLGILDAISTLN